MTLHDDPLAWAQAQPADAVQSRVLQGLARRAAAQPPGALRERLLARLQQRAALPPTPQPERPAPPGAPGPLAELLARLRPDAGPELRNVRDHQRTWSQLRLARRMAEVSAPVPEHLGPLNNQVLATRTLQQLQALAPDYLQRLLTQLDTLAALAPLQAADAPADKPTRRSGAARRR